MYKPLVKSIAIGLSALVLAPAVSPAAPVCSGVFELAPKLKYKATAEEVAALHAAYPKYVQLIEKTLANIDQLSLSPSIVPIIKVTDMKSVRGATADWNNPAVIDALPESLKKQIIDVHNLMLNKQALKDYIVDLMNDIGVLMMKEKNRETLGRDNLEQPLSAKNTTKTKKEDFLQAGAVDRNSMLKVLVSRVRSRGDQITVILSGPKGGFDSNKTKTQKYAQFWEVPRKGPFFDLYFGAGSSHGQEKHLLQMDFVEKALDPVNRREFWDYVTSTNQGSWAWDTMFDGTNSTFMHPEHIGPMLNKTLPLF